LRRAPGEAACTCSRPSTSITVWLGTGCAGGAGVDVDGAGAPACPLAAAALPGVCAWRAAPSRLCSADIAVAEAGAGPVDVGPAGGGAKPLAAVSAAIPGNRFHEAAGICPCQLVNGLLPAAAPARDAGGEVVLGGA